VRVRVTSRLNLEKFFIHPEFVLDELQGLDSFRLHPQTTWVMD